MHQFSFGGPADCSQLQHTSVCGPTPHQTIFAAVNAMLVEHFVDSLDNPRPVCRHTCQLDIYTFRPWLVKQRLSIGILPPLRTEAILVGNIRKCRCFIFSLLQSTMNQCTTVRISNEPEIKSMPHQHTHKLRADTKPKSANAYALTVPLNLKQGSHIRHEIITLPLRNMHIHLIHRAQCPSNAGRLPRNRNLLILN